MNSDYYCIVTTAVVKLVLSDDTIAESLLA